jgi:hypothetical protein
MQAEHDAKRALYMDRKLTHEQFYEWLGEPPPQVANCVLE